MRRAEGGDRGRAHRVADQGGLLQVERAHHVGQIGGVVFHRVVGPGFGGQTVAARIDHDEVVFGFERAGQARPAQAIVGESVREHQGRFVAAGAMVVQFDAVGFDVGGCPGHRRSSR